MSATEKMPYIVSVRRELRADERALLTVMVEQRPELFGQIEALKVVARCGCGECPTISLSDDANGEADTTHPWDDEIQYTGDDEYGNTVLASIIIRSGKLSELEINNLSGTTDNWGLPTLESLKRAT